MHNKKVTLFAFMILCIGVFTPVSFVHAQLALTNFNQSPLSTTTDEDVVKDIIFPNTNIEFPDQTFVFSVAPDGAPLHGTLQQISGNEFQYTPSANYFGADAIVFEVDDGIATSSFTLSIDVVSINDQPTISLVGLSPITLFVGDTFTDPGATASDIEDGDLTDSIQVSSSVDTQTAGTYSVDYTVWDSSERSASISRRVIVVEPDRTAPYTTITDPLSDSVITDYFITIFGTTTDDTAVASTTLLFAPYITSDQYTYCGAYSPIISLVNTTPTAEFGWTYNWTPSENGTYCIRAYSEDVNGNDESMADRSYVYVQNVQFTKKIDVIPPTPPTPPSGGNGPIVGSAFVTINTPTPQPIVLGASIGPVLPVIPTLPTLPKTGNVKIVWRTNKETTGQVVYGLTSSGPYTLDISKTNFGYPSASKEVTTKTTSHSITLTNVRVGQKYSVRVTSRATSRIFGPEYTFILGADGTIQSDSDSTGTLIMQDTSGGVDTIDDFLQINEVKTKPIIDSIVPNSGNILSSTSSDGGASQTALTIVTDKKISWFSTVWSKIVSVFSKKK